MARFALAVETAPEADHIVRLTGDCPLTDPQVIDTVIAAGVEPDVHYASNVHARRTFPKGLDVEVIREGFAADIVILDEFKVTDRSTFEAPHRYAEGFSNVIVNGKIVFDGQKLTGVMPGAPLRGQSRVL